MLADPAAAIYGLLGLLAARQHTGTKNRGGWGEGRKDGQMADRVRLPILPLFATRLGEVAVDPSIRFGLPFPFVRLIVDRKHLLLIGLGWLNHTRRAEDTAPRDLSDVLLSQA